MMKAFFVVLLVELFLGGGGRLVEFGGVTLRMALFSLAVTLSVLVWMQHLRSGKNGWLAWGLVVTFAGIHALGVLLGFIGGAALVDVWTDTRPLLYWLIAPFFAYMVSSSSNVRMSAALVAVSGSLLATAYLVTLFTIAAGYLDFTAFYVLLDETDEFNFRGETAFFYKGFLFLCIGLLFVLASGSSLRTVLALVVATAIVLTMTRGFILASTIAAVLLFIAMRDTRALALITMLGIVVLVWYVHFSNGLLESLFSREESDAVRLDDMAFIAGNVDAVTLLVGHGLGIPINTRLNIENSYLWIVWKLGLLGLSFWLFPLFIALDLFRRIPWRSADYRLAAAFFFSIVLIYVQTATNPYLNNPIGLSFVILALFSLSTISAPYRRGIHLARPRGRAGLAVRHV